METLDNNRLFFVSYSWLFCLGKLRITKDA